MPNTNPATTTRDLVDDKKRLATGASYAHFGFFIGATMDNLGELSAATGTPGIKIFAGSSTGDLLVDDENQLEAIFARTTLTIAAHCEDETTIRANSARYQHNTEASTHSLIRSPEVAARAIRRLSDMAVRNRHRLHVLHESSPEELAALPSDPVVTAEACIPHLFLDTESYPTLGTFAVVNPALRTPQAREVLWDALREGRVHTVATDHAPHRPEEKERPYPYCPAGIPSVENSLALMLDAHTRGRVTLVQIAQWMSAAPAQLWRIPNKGQIALGFDADLVLVDLQIERAIHNEDQWSRAGWSPWDGLTLRGWPVRTMVGGRSVYWEGQLRHLWTAPTFDQQA
jgi:dihydroorotase